MSWKFTFHCTLKIIFFLFGFFHLRSIFNLISLAFTFSYSRNAKFFTFFMTFAGAFGSFLIFIFSLSVVTGGNLFYFLWILSTFLAFTCSTILCCSSGSREHNFMILWPSWLLFVSLPLLTTFHSQNQVRINYFRFKFIAEKNIRNNFTLTAFVSSHSQDVWIFSTTFFFSSLFIKKNTLSRTRNVCLHHSRVILWMNSEEKKHQRMHV